MISLTMLSVFSQCLIIKQSIEGFIGQSILGILGECKGDEEKKQTMLVYMDEKWFWIVVKRRHNKQIVSLGTQPIAHKTHHTSHIHKVLGRATSEFLPVDKDIEKGAGQ